ncbi:MAG TPA: ester cyclase, partial [Candidatus Limnocylindria bacterium]
SAGPGPCADRLAPVIEREGPAAVVRRWVDEAWNEPDAQRRAAVLHELHSAELLNEGAVTSPAELAAWHLRMRETYPDLAYRIDELVVAGDRVTLRWTATGTQRGSLWGLVPPTGRQVTWRGVHLATVRDGRIVEVWAAANTAEVLQQLGVRLLPPESSG